MLCIVMSQFIKMEKSHYKILSGRVLAMQGNPVTGCTSREGVDTEPLNNAKDLSILNGNDLPIILSLYGKTKMMNSDNKSNSLTHNIVPKSSLVENQLALSNTFYPTFTKVMNIQYKNVSPSEHLVPNLKTVNKPNFVVGNISVFETEIQLDQKLSYPVLHCISEDRKLTKGFALSVRTNTKDLDLQMSKPYQGVLSTRTDLGNTVYHVITKPKFFHKPRPIDFKHSISSAIKYLSSEGIGTLIIPFLGVGLDKLEPSFVLRILQSSPEMSFELYVPQNLPNSVNINHVRSLLCEKDSSPKPLMVKNTLRVSLGITRMKPLPTAEYYTVPKAKTVALEDLILLKTDNLNTYTFKNRIGIHQETKSQIQSIVQAKPQVSALVKFPIATPLSKTVSAFPIVICPKVQQGVIVSVRKPVPYTVRYHDPQAFVLPKKPVRPLVKSQSPSLETLNSYSSLESQIEEEPMPYEYKVKVHKKDVRVKNPKPINPIRVPVGLQPLLTHAVTNNQTFKPRRAKIHDDKFDFKIAFRLKIKSEFKPANVKDSDLREFLIQESNSPQLPQHGSFTFFPKDSVFVKIFSSDLRLSHIPRTLGFTLFLQYAKQCITVKQAFDLASFCSTLHMLATSGCETPIEAATVYSLAYSYFSRRDHYTGISIDTSFEPQILRLARESYRLVPLAVPPFSYDTTYKKGISSLDSETRNLHDENYQLLSELTGSFITKPYDTAFGFIPDSVKKILSSTKSIDHNIDTSLADSVLPFIRDTIVFFGIEDTIPKTKLRRSFSTYRSDACRTNERSFRDRTNSGLEAVLRAAPSHGDALLYRFVETAVSLHIFHDIDLASAIRQTIPNFKLSKSQLDTITSIIPIAASTLHYKDLRTRVRTSFLSEKPETIELLAPFQTTREINGFIELEKKYSFMFFIRKLVGIKYNIIKGLSWRYKIDLPANVWEFGNDPANVITHLFTLVNNESDFSLANQEDSVSCSNSEDPHVKIMRENLLEFTSGDSFNACSDENSFIQNLANKIFSFPASVLENVGRSLGKGVVSGAAQQVTQGMDSSSLSKEAVLNTIKETLKAAKSTGVIDQVGQEAVSLITNSLTEGFEESLQLIDTILVSHITKLMNQLFSFLANREIPLPEKMFTLRPTNVVAALLLWIKSDYSFKILPFLVFILFNGSGMINSFLSILKSTFVNIYRMCAHAFTKFTSYKCDNCWLCSAFPMLKSPNPEENTSDDSRPLATGKFDSVFAGLSSENRKAAEQLKTSQDKPKSSTSSTPETDQSSYFSIPYGWICWFFKKISDGFPLAIGLAAAGLAGAFGLSMSFTPSGLVKKVETALKTFNMTAGAITNIPKIVTATMAMVSVTMGFISSKIFNGKNNTYSITKAVHEWVDTASYFISPGWKEALGGDQGLGFSYMRFYARGIELRSSISLIEPGYRDLFIKTLNEIKNMYSSVMVSMIIHSGKSDPFVIQIYGESQDNSMGAGVGKTNVVDLMRYVASEAFKTPTSTYYHNPNLNYWDAYSGQPIVVMDELFSMKADPSISELLRNLSGVPSHLNMANLSDKGACFDSNVVIGTTNNPFPEIDDVICHQAVWRRRNVLIRVKRHDEIIEPCANTFLARMTFDIIEPTEPNVPIKVQGLELTDMNWKELSSYVFHVAQKHIFNETVRSKERGSYDFLIRLKETREFNKVLISQKLSTYSRACSTDEEMKSHTIEVTQYLEKYQKHLDEMYNCFTNSTEVSLKETAKSIGKALTNTPKSAYYNSTQTPEEIKSALPDTVTAQACSDNNDSDTSSHGENSTTSVDEIMGNFTRVHARPRIDPVLHTSDIESQLPQWLPISPTDAASTATNDTLSDYESQETVDPFSTLPSQPHYIEQWQHSIQSRMTNQQTADSEGDVFEEVIDEVYHEPTAGIPCFETVREFSVSLQNTEGWVSLNDPVFKDPHFSKLIYCEPIFPLDGMSAVKKSEVLYNTLTPVNFFAMGSVPTSSSDFDQFANSPASISRSNIMVKLVKVDRKCRTVQSHLNQHHDFIVQEFGYQPVENLSLLSVKNILFHLNTEMCGITLHKALWKLHNNNSRHLSQVTVEQYFDKVYQTRTSLEKQQAQSLSRVGNFFRRFKNFCYGAWQLFYSVFHAGMMVATAYICIKTVKSILSSPSEATSYTNPVQRRPMRHAALANSLSPFAPSESTTKDFVGKKILIIQLFDEDGTLISTGTGIGVRGNLILSVYHTFSIVKNRTSVICKIWDPVQVVDGGSFAYSFVLYMSKIHKVEGKDLCMFAAPGMRQLANITKHFIPTKELDRITTRSDIPAMIVSAKLRKNNYGSGSGNIMIPEVIPVNQVSLKKSQVYYEKYMVADENGNVTRVENEIFHDTTLNGYYGSFHASKEQSYFMGVSGSPVVHEENRLLGGKIMGLMGASSHRQAMAIFIPVSKEMVESMIEKFELFDQIAPLDLMVNECPPDNPTAAMLTAGPVYLHQPPIVTPPVTRFKPSPIFDQVSSYPNITKPAPLRMSNEWKTLIDQGVPHFASIGLNKYNRIYPCIDTYKLNESAILLADYYFVKLGLSNVRMHTVDEAILGALEPGSNPMDLSKSAGPPYCQMPNANGKHHLIDKDQNGDIIYSHLFKIDYSTLYNSCLNKEPESAIFGQFLKDELIPIDKMKTRFVAMCPVTVQVLGRQLMASLFNALKTSSIHDFPMASGLNLESHQYHDMIKVIESDKVLAWDCKNLDGSVPPYLRFAVMKFIERIIVLAAQARGEEYPQDHITLLYSYFTIVAQCFLKYHDVLFKSLGGMKSGEFGTTELNTIGNIILLYHSYRQTMEMVDPLSLSPEAFTKIFHILMLGDDGCARVIEPYDIIFDAKWFVSAFSNFGITVTPDSKKDADLVPVPLVESSFLKMTPLWREDLSRYVGVIKPSVISGLLNWVSTTEPVSSQFPSNILSALRFVFQSGEEIYNNFRSLIISEVSKLPIKYSYNFPSYSDMDKWIQHTPDYNLGGGI